MKKNSAAAFLENMEQVVEAAEVTPPAVAQKKGSGAAVPKTRDGLKHLGGYCDPATVEKFAILRARLNLDNSECLTLAIQELYSKQKAKKAFNDQ